MSTTRKVVIGIGIAGGALLAAWLLTGDRKNKTKEFMAKKKDDLKRSFKKPESVVEDPDAHYV